MRPSDAAVSLPTHWPRYLTSALVHVIALARSAVADVHGGFFVSPILRVRLHARIDRLENELAQAREQIRIKDSRMACIDPRKRPHYAPQERLAILTLRAATGWSAAETARVFLVTPPTIADWSCTLHRDGADALVAPRTPINRFADFVGLVVRHLHRSFPAMGSRRIAQTLARAVVRERPAPERVVAGGEVAVRVVVVVDDAAGRQRHGFPVVACVVRVRVPEIRRVFARLVRP